MIFLGHLPQHILEKTIFNNLTIFNLGIARFDYGCTQTCKNIQKRLFTPDKEDLDLVHFEMAWKICLNIKLYNLEYFPGQTPPPILTQSIHY